MTKKQSCNERISLKHLKFKTTRISGLTSFTKPQKKRLKRECSRERLQRMLATQSVDRFELMKSYCTHQDPISNYFSNENVNFFLNCNNDSSSKNDRIKILIKSRQPKLLEKISESDFKAFMNVRDPIEKNRRIELILHSRCSAFIQRIKAQDINAFISQVKEGCHEHVSAIFGSRCSNSMQRLTVSDLNKYILYSQTKSEAISKIIRSKLHVKFKLDFFRQLVTLSPDLVQTIRSAINNIKGTNASYHQNACIKILNIIGAAPTTNVSQEQRASMSSRPRMQDITTDAVHGLLAFFPPSPALMSTDLQNSSANSKSAAPQTPSVNGRYSPLFLSSQLTHQRHEAPESATMFPTL